MRRTIALILLFVISFTDLAHILLFGLVPRVRTAEAAAGDFAIYREATAGDTITTANFDHNWDTEVAT